MESAMGAPAPEPQDHRLREQLIAEREEAASRRDGLLQEMEAQRSYHEREIDRCERVVAACTAALDTLEPTKMAVPPPPDYNSARAQQAQGGLQGGLQGAVPR